jgi:hypothetical protein
MDEDGNAIGVHHPGLDREHEQDRLRQSTSTLVEPRPPGARHPACASSAFDMELRRTLLLGLLEHRPTPAPASRAGAPGWRAHRTYAVSSAGSRVKASCRPPRPGGAYSAPVPRPADSPGLATREWPCAVGDIGICTLPRRPAGRREPFVWVFHRRAPAQALLAPLTARSGAVVTESRGARRGTLQPRDLGRPRVVRILECRRRSGAEKLSTSPDFLVPRGGGWGAPGRAPGQRVVHDPSRATRLRTRM